MRYLIEMHLEPLPPAMAPQDSLSFIEQMILPTLDALETFEQRGTVVAGGPIAGSIALALIVEADSQAVLDSIFAALPVWTRMKTVVRPLTTFSARKASVLATAERVRSRLGAATPKP